MIQIGDAEVQTIILSVIAGIIVTFIMRYVFK